MEPRRRSIQTDGSIGTYSSAVVVDRFCFVSGQAALDTDGRVVDGTIVEQVHATIRNVEAVLRASDFHLDDVVKVTCYLSDMDYWAEMDRVFGEYFGDSPPARATVQANLIYGCLVEMECVAWKPPTGDLVPSFT